MQLPKATLQPHDQHHVHNTHAQVYTYTQAYWHSLKNSDRTSMILHALSCR